MNNRHIRLIKDILFVAVCIWLISMSKMLAVLVGILGLAWYGRDAYYQIKAIWQEKTYKGPEAPKDGPTTTPPPDDKITVTNLDDAKEVDYTKE